MYVQGKNQGLGEIDWNSIIKDVVGGYAAVKAVQTQASLAKAQINTAQMAPQLPINYQLNPNYSPTYAGQPQPQKSNLMPLLLIGGAAVLIFVMMK